MRMLRVTKSLTIAAALSLGAISFGASAAMIESLLNPGVNQFEDTDVERIVDANGNLVTDGKFEKGYVIQSILRFTNLNSSPISDHSGFDTPYELTAYAELEIAKVTHSGNSYLLKFKPHVGGYLTGNPFGKGVHDSQVFAKLFETETPTASDNYNSSLPPQQGISHILNGNLVAILGSREVDDFWLARVPVNDISVVASAAPGSPQDANGTAGLSFLWAEWEFTPNGMVSGARGTLHDVVLSASAYALDTTANDGWLVSSNTSLRFRRSPRQVPAPGTTALIGLGLLVVAGLKCRRHTKA